MFILLAVANMSEKTPLDLWGVYTPLWGATETTFHSSENWKISKIDAWDDFDNTGKKQFSYLKERSQKSKKLVKGEGVSPINPSPIDNSRSDITVLFEYLCKLVFNILLLLNIDFE